MEKIVVGGELTMGVLARRVGLNVSAIRYYESVGLIPKAMRRASGHRVYGAQIEGVLMLIRQCRVFGFSVDETRELVSLSTSQDAIASRRATLRNCGWTRCAPSGLNCSGWSEVFRLLFRLAQTLAQAARRRTAAS
jgi:DNA-binding transcriptional MerR regulator